MKLSNSLRAPALLAAALTIAQPLPSLAATQVTGEPAVIQIEPMPDGAKQGVGCLAAALSSLGATYALGPTETMLLVTGAVIVPSSSSLLGMALIGIMATGTCGVGALATPAVLWAVDQGHAIDANAKATLDQWFASVPSATPVAGGVIAASAEAPAAAPPAVRPMTDAEKQGSGCLIGSSAISLSAMAAGPSEIVGLAAGGVTIASSTGLLALGMIGTLIPAGCSIGALITPTVLALADSLTDFGSRVAESGRRLAGQIGQVAGTPATAVELADGSAALHR